ncbi:MAG TPA: ABC transporter ATP-binding protein [Planctomycetota bacterium]|nr:ABC transporter ATP-binding protein [Planctomycetota bacterium]
MGGYLELWNVTKAFETPRGRQVVVKDFTLNIREGEFVCLIGHSGCGKSTVLSMVAGLSPLTAGGMILAGCEISGPGTDRGVVFQAPCLLPWLSALDNVLLAVDEAHGKLPVGERRRIAGEALKRVGLGSAMHQKPAGLSQGMRQRVGLARAFALSPRMFLLDEPFGMLDSLTRIDLQQLLMELRADDRKTVLMVTHDVDEALFLADRVVVMTRGPEARVGWILDVPFAQPRDRSRLLDDPEYYACRERLIGYLDDAGPGPAKEPQAPRELPAVAPPRLEPAVRKT